MQDIKGNSKSFRAVIFKPIAMQHVAVIFCAVFSVAVADRAVEIPKNLKLCNRQSSDYNGCLKDAIQDAIPKFAKGYPELDIPVLDPFPTPFQDIVHRDPLFTGKASMKDVNTYGTSKAQILNVRSTVSEDSQRLEIEVALPKILVEGQYKVEGTMVAFELGGKGFFNVSMEGVRTVLNISGPIVNDRWVVQHFVMLPEVEKMRVYFDDLFNGVEALNIAARSFVNEYWPVFYQALLPGTAAVWDKEMTEFVNRFFSKVSYSKIFA